MSQQTVGRVVERLLTEEHLRMQFAAAPLETIVDLHLRGLCLTPEEIDALVQTDAKIWFWIDLDVKGPAH